MLRILLVRSAASEYDQQGRIQGNLDIPLSEDGRRQAEELAGQLNDQPLEAIYVCPCQAAMETAEAIGASRKLQPKSLDKLKNLDHGLWQGMLVEDVKKKQPKVYRQWQEQPETVCPPRGETIHVVEERVESVVAKLAKKHKGGELIGIVATEPLTSVIRHVLRKEDLGDLWSGKNGTAAWERIDFEPTPAGAR